MGASGKGKQKEVPRRDGGIDQVGNVKKEDEWNRRGNVAADAR